MMRKNFLKHLPTTFHLERTRWKDRISAGRLLFQRHPNSRHSWMSSNKSEGQIIAFSFFFKILQKMPPYLLRFGVAHQDYGVGGKCFFDSKISSFWPEGRSLSRNGLYVHNLNFCSLATPARIYLMKRHPRSSGSIKSDGKSGQDDQDGE